MGTARRTTDIPGCDVARLRCLRCAATAARHLLDDRVDHLWQCPRRLRNDAHERQRGGDDLRPRHVAGRADQLGADARHLVEEGHRGGTVAATASLKDQNL